MCIVILPQLPRSRAGIKSFALLNDNISNEMIDGALFQEQVEANNIHVACSPYSLNGKPFANGLIDTTNLIEKLQEQFPDLLSEGAMMKQNGIAQDVTIIGVGPAGVAAAIYTARMAPRLLWWLIVSVVRSKTRRTSRT